MQEMATLRNSQQIWKRCTVCNEHCPCMSPVEFLFVMYKIYLSWITPVELIQKQLMHVKTNYQNMWKAYIVGKQSKLEFRMTIIYQCGTNKLVIDYSDRYEVCAE